MALISPVAVALGVGTAGAMVDVTSFVTGDSTVSARWGSTDQFRDIGAGSFSFTLDNYDGRFTPGNPSSPLATPVQEGTPVCWQLGSRLMSGTILNFQFPDSAEERGRITITCDDALGDLSRYKMPESGFMPQIESAASTLLLWPLDDSSSEVTAAEVTGNGVALAPSAATYYNPATATFYPVQQVVGFGASSPAFLNQTGMAISNQSESTFLSAGLPIGMPVNSSIGSVRADFGNSTYGSVCNFSYASGVGGYWGFWCDTVVGTGAIEFAVTSRMFPNGQSRNMPWGGISLDVTSSTVVLNAGDFNTGAASFPITPGPHYYALGITGTFASGNWTTNITVWIDGVQQTVGATNSWAFSSAAGSLGPTWNPNPWTVMLNVYGVASGTVSRVGHFMSNPNVLNIGATGSEAGRITFYDGVIPTLGTVSISSTLSTAPLGQSVQTGSALDALNAIVKTEQGYLYPVTTGTVTSPSVALTIRERSRETTPKVSFDAVTDIEGVLPFERNLTNLVATQTTTGDDAIAEVTDSTIVGRARYASGSDKVLLSQVPDLQQWGFDRINRGKVTAPWPTKIVVDAATTSTDRSTDLLGLVPGDRVSITNINSTVTGFSSWDGWLLGAEETHTPFMNEWTLYLAPVTSQAVLDTSLLDFDGIATLVADVDSSVTTVTVAANGSLNLSDASVLPVNIQIDGEIMTVTATTPSGGNVALTVTRAAAGSTAAAHSAGETVSLISSAITAF